MLASAFSLTPTVAEDAEPLAELRVEAMRESLTRIGRFDRDRARARLLDAFSTETARHIEVEGRRVGFVVLTRHADAMDLDHLYLRADARGRGIGSAVLARITAEASRDRLRVRVTALQGSDANRFYERHGFRLVASSEWDNHYEFRASPLG